MLAHLVSHGSRGLFERAIVESGAFALNQQSLASAEAAGEAFAAKVGCADQTAACLRNLPVVGARRTSPTPASRASSTARSSPSRSAQRSPPAASPTCRSSTASTTTRSSSSWSGSVLPSATGRSSECRAPASYESAIASVLGVSPARAAAIAADYPVQAPIPVVRLPEHCWCPTRTSRARHFRSTAGRRSSVPTFAYEFDDDSAPQRFAPPGRCRRSRRTRRRSSTSSTSRTRRFPRRSTPTQEALAASDARRVGELRRQRQPVDGSSPVAVVQRRLERAVAQLAAAAARDELRATHHCAFWAAG